MNSNRLSRLAINHEGFVFDPQSGESFTTNASGLVILKAMQEETSDAFLIQALQKKFHVSAEEAASDIRDFIEHLISMKFL